MDDSLRRWARLDLDLVVDWLEVCDCTLDLITPHEDIVQIVRAHVQLGLVLRHLQKQTTHRPEPEERHADPESVRRWAAKGAPHERPHSP
jgi:hypothetical protein